MLNKKGCWEIPGCDGVGVMGHVSGVMVVVVMAWGCGDNPFLVDGNYGVMVESPGCDGVGVVGVCVRGHGGCGDGVGLW